MANEPITREEMLLNAVATGVSSGIEPITREEMYLAYIGGQDVIPPEPITRKEQFLSMIAPGGGSGVTIRNQNKTVTENGTYTADAGYTGLGIVTVAVPIPDVEETWFSTEGQMYTKNIFSEETTYLRGYAYRGCTYLEAAIFPNCAGLGGSWVLSDNPALKTVKLGKVKNVISSTCRDSSMLEEVELGSIGYPVLSMVSTSLYNPTAAFTVTIYVDAATLADIPTAVSDTAPWGAPNATIIYRNSTTGEVITE